MEQQSGWYPDPDGVRGLLRWWDGDRWTDLTTPGPTPGGESGPRGAGPGHGEEMLLGPGGAGGPGGLGASLGERVRVALDRRWQSVRGNNRATGVAVVLAVVLVLVVGLLVRHAVPPTDVARVPAAGPTARSGPVRPVPPLATLCPAGQSAPTPTPGAPAPAGPRVSDPDAGISYTGMGAPWKPWNQFWTGGILGVHYGTGYAIVTQRNVADSGTDYYASVLSGSVPATAGDALHPAMRCVAERVAEDARRSFYPQPNTRTVLADRSVTVEGHAGYVIKFHLTFTKAGYDAKGELAEILVLDVGTPRVAVLYVSIPDTVRKYDPVADKVVASVAVP